MWPSALKNLDIGTPTPYFALTFDCTASKSGPEVTNVAAPSTTSAPDLTRPRASLGATVIRGLLRSRLALPVADEVQKPNRPPSSGTIHVVVVTASPDFR